MARIVEEFVVVKVSKLVKTNEEVAPLVGDELKAALGELIGASLVELTGDASLVVEVEEGE